MEQLIKYNDEIADRVFMGSHPVITGAGILASGQNLEAGTVVGKITASGKLTLLNPGAADGSEIANTILYGAKDATEGDEPVIIVEHGEGIGDSLIWPEAITDQQKTAAISALKENGIYVK